MNNGVSYIKGKITSPSMTAVMDAVIEVVLNKKDNVFPKFNSGLDEDKFVKNTTYSIANQIHPKIYKFFKALFLEQASNPWNLPIEQSVDVDFIDLINYKVGHYLDWHIDTSAEQYYKSIVEHKWALTDFDHGNRKNKKISITLCLSDKQTYEGGVFEIANLYEPGVAFSEQLDKFEYVIFPSCLPHRVTPITKGERWAVATWANGPEFT